MRNEEIAKLFDDVADMLEIGGENFFRVRAYRNAARAVRDFPAPVAELPPERFKEIPGFGADLSDKLGTLLETGDLPIRAELIRTFPAGLLQLKYLPGLGPKRIKLLADRLRIRGPDDLKCAIEAGQLRTIRGFGAKIEQRLLEALAREPEARQPRRIHCAGARIAADAILAHMRGCVGLERIEVAGSFRRRRETVGDLDIVAASDNAGAVIERFLAFPGIIRILGSGETRASVVLSDDLQVDLRAVPRASWGAALIYFTGSQAHCVHIRRIAQNRGLLLNEYGLYRGEDSIAGAEEEEVYRGLGLPWIAPELREDRGEIDAARDGRLPHLVELADLRGDLHAHSLWTDGRASIEEMARAAHAAGLEYFAMTDHSQRLAMVHGLDAGRLREQWREIESIAARVSGIAILRGIEVDILEDGTLDLDDEVLAELDWVVASVHSKLEMESAAMTRRLIRAIRNPNVDVIGHPSGRVIGQREASGFDLAEVLRVAREEGCGLEVNSQPHRLDLTDTAVMAAKHAGVRLVISSDAHSTAGFGLLQYGISQARRGWLEAPDVLNTRPLAEMRQRR
ncbi:MAG TPA: DNA polymerase/3'-5' exonuclease PolX [Candidatus Binataceae bacterium]|nr:DNA polymerase/3'-5' exonuclease PolX [Candidatus Binataceae bacterium]